LQEIADPFYAYCKQHVDKAMMKYKRRNYLAVQSNLRAKRERVKLDANQDVSLQIPLLASLLSFFISLLFLFFLFCLSP
jgi:hypothetical protein